MNEWIKVDQEAGWLVQSSGKVVEGMVEVLTSGVGNMRR
jgi:hypothetical protein